MTTVDMRAMIEILLKEAFLQSDPGHVCKEGNILVVLLFLNHVYYIDSSRRQNSPSGVARRRRRGATVHDVPVRLAQVAHIARPFGRLSVDTDKKKQFLSTAASYM